jgi:hypothetical protein
VATQRVATAHHCPEFPRDPAWRLRVLAVAPTRPCISAANSGPSRMLVQLKRLVAAA